MFSRWKAAVRRLMESLSAICWMELSAARSSRTSISRSVRLNSSLVVGFCISSRTILATAGLRAACPLNTCSMPWMISVPVAVLSK